MGTGETQMELFDLHQIPDWTTGTSVYLLRHYLHCSDWLFDFAYLVSEQAQVLLPVLSVIRASSTVNCVVISFEKLKFTPLLYFLFDSKGMPMELPASIVKLRNQVLAESGIDERYYKMIDVFMMSGYIEPIFLGSLKLLEGMKLGIPKNYEYKDIKDIEKWEWLVRNILIVNVESIFLI